MTDSHMSRRGKLDGWVLGPFVVMTLSQTCREDGAGITPGATAYRCADGNVRCAGHRPYRTPEWLRERNNDPYGTPNKVLVDGILVNNPFWESQPAELVGVWKLFSRDGWWFGYKTTQNAWAHFRTEAKARAMAEGPQVDIWA